MANEPVPFLRAGRLAQAGCAAILQLAAIRGCVVQKGDLGGKGCGLGHGTLGMVDT